MDVHHFNDGRRTPTFIWWNINKGNMYVNRKNEIEKLEKIWNRAKSSGRLVLLVGPQGVGKYSFVKNFSIQKKAKFIHYRCDRWEPNIPLGTLRRFMSVHYPHISIRKNITSEKLFEKVMNELNDGNKKIIYVENIHYADSLSLKFILRFAMKPPKGVILIAGYQQETERKELNDIFERLVIGDMADIIIMDNLSKSEVKKYLKEEALKEDVIEKIYEITKGNPLHMSLILKYYRKKKKMGYFESIEKAILENYKIMSNEEKEILQIGSVMGNMFFREIVEEIMGKNVEKSLKNIVKDGWVESFNQRYQSKLYESYAFIHDSFSGVLYSTIPEKKKMELHRKIGKIIEEKKIYTEWERFYELLNHYIMGKCTDKGLIYLEKAINDSIRLGDYRASVYYLKKYENFLNSINDDVKRAWLYHMLYYSLKYYGNLKESVEYIDKELGFSILKKAEIYRVMGKFKEAIKLSRMGRKFEDEYLKMISYRIEGDSLRRLGLYRRALNSFKKNLEIAMKLNNDREIALAYKNLGNAYLSMMNDTEGEKYYRKAMKIFKKLNDLSGISAIYNNMGIVFSQRGLLEKAREYYLKSLKIDEKLKDFETLGTAYNNIGTVLEALGEVYDAMESYRKSVEYNLLIGALDGAEYAYSNLSSVLTESGNFKEAENYTRKEIDIAEKTESVKFRISGYMSLSNIYYFTEKYEEGIKYAKKAIAIGKKYENYYDSVDSYYYLARIYYDLGYREKCMGELNRALKIYRELKIEDRASHIYSLLAKCEGEKIIEGMEKIVKIRTPIDKCEVLMAKAIVYAKNKKESKKYYDEAVKILKNLKKFATLSKFMEEYGELVNDEKILKEVKSIKKNFEY